MSVILPPSVYCHCSVTSRYCSGMSACSLRSVRLDRYDRSHLSHNQPNIQPSTYIASSHHAFHASFCCQNYYWCCLGSDCLEEDVKTENLDNGESVLSLPISPDSKGAIPESPSSSIVSSETSRSPYSTLANWTGVTGSPEIE